MQEGISRKNELERGRKVGQIWKRKVKRRAKTKFKKNDKVLAKADFFKNTALQNNRKRRVGTILQFSSEAATGVPSYLVEFEKTRGDRNIKAEDMTFWVDQKSVEEELELMKDE